MTRRHADHRDLLEFRFRAQCLRWFPSVGVVGSIPAALILLIALQAGTAAANPPDPILSLLHRASAFFRRTDLQEITFDPRYAENPSELVRLSVVAQLLAYNDLYHADSLDPYRREIAARADFLIERFEEIRSESAFDGMLAYALLGAYEITGDVRYRDRAREIVDFCLSLRGFQMTLNWGLMAGMALAKYYHLTGDPRAFVKTLEIIRSLEPWKNSDGSFPHYCYPSTDVHYTGWMGMELMHIARYYDDPQIQQQLQGMHRFLRHRVGPDGRTRYQEPCPDRPECWIYYYSFASGCSIDYDTRAWNNEVGYNAMILDRFRDARYHDVMGFLYALEERGAFDDKWDFFPHPDDPSYVWANNDPSVVRTSIIFWSLASIYRERKAPVPRRYEGGEELVAIAPPRRFTAAAAPRPWPPSVPAAGVNRESWRRFRWSRVDSLVLEDADPRDACCTSGSSEEPLRRLRPETTHDGAALAGGVATVTDRLCRVSPNPARRAAAVEFQLAKAATVSLAVYDAGGRMARELASGSWPSGTHRVLWDGLGKSGAVLPTGIYFFRLAVNERPVGTIKGALLE